MGVSTSGTINSNAGIAREREIVAAEVIVCCPARNFVTLKIVTRSGVTGIGDATLNGRELADVAVKKKPGLKVLFATGYTRNAIIHHGRLDPGVDVLMKPYSYELLARKIRAVLDNQHPAP